MSESRTTTSAVFQLFWPSVRRFNKWPSWAHSLTPYCPMDCDAYLTGSTSLQHLCYKTKVLLSYSVTLRCKSECTDSLYYMHHWTIRSTQTLLLMIMKDGTLLSLFSFKPVAEHFGSNTHSCCYQTFLIITIYSKVFTTTLQFVWLSDYNGLQSWAKMSFPSKKKPSSIGPCGELLHTWTNKKPTTKDFIGSQGDERISTLVRKLHPARW